MAMPIDIGKVKKVADRIQGDVDSSIKIDVYYDSTCNKDLVSALKKFFESKSEGVDIRWIDVSYNSYQVDTSTFSIIISGENSISATVYKKLNKLCVTKSIVCLDPSYILDSLKSQKIKFNYKEIICPSIESYSRVNGGHDIDFDNYNDKIDLDIKTKISKWIYDLSLNSEVFYAAKFPFLRKMCANGIINSCTLQNAGIGVIKILPGADMPLMTLNQVRMLLSLAAIYGYQVNEDRVLEIITIVASAFGMRKVSSVIKDITKIPDFVVDGSMGLSATYILGTIAKEYFSNGLAIDGLVDKCKSFFQK